MVREPVLAFDSVKTLARSTKHSHQANKKQTSRLQSRLLNSFDTAKEWVPTNKKNWPALKTVGLDMSRLTFEMRGSTRLAGASPLD